MAFYVWLNQFTKKIKVTEVISFVCIQVDKQKLHVYLNKSYIMNYEIIQHRNDENHWFLSLPKGRQKEQKNEIYRVFARNASKMMYIFPVRADQYNNFIFKLSHGYG